MNKLHLLPHHRSRWVYLAGFFEKGYEVHGLRRRISIFNTQRMNHLYDDEHKDDVKVHLHYGDMTDTLALPNN